MIRIPMADVINSRNVDDIFQIFLRIINLSFDNNVFPESEKSAIIKPIVKGKLDPQSLNSYRPVIKPDFYRR